MHPNEIRINASNILELYDTAELLGPNYHTALRDQIIRQEAEKNSTALLEVIEEQIKRQNA
jgi:hypothetical protein